VGKLFNVILVKEERPPLQKSAAWLMEPTDRARSPSSIPLFLTGARSKQPALNQPGRGLETIETVDNFLRQIIRGQLDLHLVAGEHSDFVLNMRPEIVAFTTAPLSSSTLSKSRLTPTTTPTHMANIDIALL
jgi:hypothetical protein